VRYLSRMLGSQPSADVVPEPPSTVPTAGRWAHLVADPWHRRCLLALVLIATLVQLREAWAVQIILMAALLALPGLLLLRALRVPGAAISAFPAYVPGASLVVLLGCGLATDLIGPLLGVDRPLSPEPLLVGLEVSCLALLAAGARAGPETAIAWRSLARAPSRLSWPLLLPLLAAAGALRLNNGHGSAVAIVAVAACGLALIAVLAFASRLDTASLTVVLYAVAVALMWGFSLRGNLVYGFDIATEYHALQQTVTTGVWHTAHVGDAYGALLSVTVLPAELHATTGLPALLVFKVAYPAISAVFPVAVFGLASKVLTRRWAFTAGALVVVQETFFQQLPGLARQEIAMVLFCVLVGAILDGHLSRRPQLALVALFGLGMAVSHYSTTYFAIVMFGVALALQWAVSWVRSTPRVLPAMATAILVVTVCAGIWYGLVTRSASNLSQLAGAAQGQGFDLLPTQGGASLLARYLQAGASTQINAAEYARQIHAYYAANVPYVHPLPDAGSPAYALQNSAETSPAVRWLLGLNAASHAELIIEQLMNLVAALGALGMVLRRNSSVICRQVGLLGLATLVILAMIRLSGTAQAAYNPERAFLQALVVLAVSLCWVLQEFAGPNRRRRRLAVLAGTGAVVAVFFANTSGLTGAVLGGGTKTNLANTGSDYDQFDMSTPELAAASWVGAAASPGQLIYADRYAQLRLNAVIGSRPAEPADITPLTLNQQAWVYADRTNVRERTGQAFFNNESAAYAFPFPFLNANYDLVYSDGSAEVFFR
jgi:uncharacterized membrane protein